MTDFKTTYETPRFLAFIESAYLYEAMQAALDVFKHKREGLDPEKDRDKLGNINAADQNLRRAFFISIYSHIEQNLDELCLMSAGLNGITFRPNELKDRGIKLSLVFARKFLNANIDQNKEPWSSIFKLQNVRNHIVHYGAGFNDSQEHINRANEFQSIPGIILTPSICFKDGTLEKIFDNFVLAINEFGEVIPGNSTN